MTKLLKGISGKDLLEENIIFIDNFKAEYFARRAIFVHACL